MDTIVTPIGGTVAADNRALEAYCAELRRAHAPNNRILMIQIPQVILGSFNREIALKNLEAPVAEGTGMVAVAPRLAWPRFDPTRFLQKTSLFYLYSSALRSPPSRASVPAANSR